MTETTLLNTFAKKISTNNRILIGMQPEFFKKILHCISPKMIISVIPDTIDEKSRISSIIYENKLQIKDINFISIEEGQVPYMDIMFINIISPQLVLLIKNLLKKEYTSPHETYFIMRKSQKKDIDNLKRLKWDEIDGEWIYTQYSYKTKYGSTEMKSLFLNEEDVIYGENDDV